jgi:CotS family spore coat protein
MQNLNHELGELYGFEILSVIPYKEMLLLHTTDGKKLLKKSLSSTERLLFIHAAKEHLAGNGFSCTDRYAVTLEGNPFALLDGDCYTVIPVIEGRECNFDNRQDVIGSARLLASLHKASKGFIPPSACSPRDDLGKLPSYFTKRLDEIKKMKKQAQKTRGRFDGLFLEHVDYFYQLGESTIYQIAHSGYEELVKKAFAEGALCHHDFTHHNIICSEEGLYLANFDYCCLELKVYDIANFLRRKMRKCNWNMEEAGVILKEYNTLEPLCEEELKTMKIILQFPQKFWRVANRYYNSRHGLSDRVYLSKLQEVIDEAPYHKKFLEEFPVIIR